MPIIKEDPLRRYDPTDFSFRSVKEEVSEAMRFDWKRDKVDDAKKRAIYDSKCYDEFKDRVAGCTLKPIHRNEFNAPPKMSFNNHVERQAGEKPSVPLFGNVAEDAGAPPSTTSSSGYTGACRGSVLREKVPRNGHEFERELRRRATADDKIRLLELVLENRDMVTRVFGRELDGEMLRQVLAALEEVSSRGDSNGIARRFFVALAVDCPVSIGAACSFFDAEERGTIARLLAQDPAADSSEDIRVCAAFGMPPSSVAAAASTLTVPVPATTSVEEAQPSK
jgi:hypothetical protein